MSEESRPAPKKRVYKLANPANIFEEEIVDPLKIALQAQVEQKDPKDLVKAPLAAATGRRGARPSAAPAARPAARPKSVPAASPSVKPEPVPEPVATVEPAAVAEPVAVPEPVATVESAAVREPVAVPEPVAVLEPVAEPIPEPVAEPIPEAVADPPRVITWSEQVAAEALLRERDAAARAVEETTPASEGAGEPARVAEADVVQPPVEPEPARPKRVREMPRLVPEVSQAEEIARAGLAAGDSDDEAARIRANRERLQQLAARLAAQGPLESPSSRSGVEDAEYPQTEDPAEEAARIAANRERLRALAERVAQSSDAAGDEVAVDFAVPDRRPAKARSESAISPAVRDDAAS